MRWERDGELATFKDKTLERGVLLTVSMSGRRNYQYHYADTRELDSSSAMLQQRGFQGGGCSWAGIVHGLVSLRAPKIMAKIDFDPNSDELVVHSISRAALIAVSNLVAECMKDQRLLEAAIERATLDGEME